MLLLERLRNAVQPPGSQGFTDNHDRVGDVVADPGVLVLEAAVHSPLVRHYLAPGLPANTPTAGHESAETERHSREMPGSYSKLRVLCRASSGGEHWQPFTAFSIPSPCMKLYSWCGEVVRAIMRSDSPCLLH